MKITQVRVYYLLYRFIFLHNQSENVRCLRKTFFIQWTNQVNNPDMNTTFVNTNILYKKYNINISSG